jgi:hypothetical protein
VRLQLASIFASVKKVMGKAPGIVYRTLATHLTRKAGYTKTTAHTGVVTLIQRFGSALNLNIHLMCMDARMPRAHGCAGAAHIIFLDGVYVDDASPVKLTSLIRLTITAGGAQNVPVLTLPATR